MKKWCVGALWTLCAVMLFGISASAESESADYSVLPEQYVALEEYVPEELSSLLPTGLFSSDAEQVQQALAQLTSFAGVVRLLMRLCGLQLGEIGGVLASVCGLLMLCALMRSLSNTWGVAWAGYAPRLCLFAAVAAAGYSSVEKMVEYFDALRTLMDGLMPMMSVMYILGGNITRATAGNATLSVALRVCSDVCGSMAPPLFGTCMAMTLPCVMEAQPDLSRISGFLKKAYTSVLGILTLLLTLCLSAQTLLATRADSVAMRSGRYAIGQLIPVVGGALSGSLDTLAAGVGMLRVLAGGCGVLLLVLTCLPVLVQMLALRMLFDLGAGLAHLMGCTPESVFLGEASSLFGYMTAAVAMCTVVFIIAVGAFAACAAAWVS